MTGFKKVQNTRLKSNSPKDKIEFYNARIVELEKEIINLHNRVEHTTGTIQSYRGEIHELWKEMQEKTCTTNSGKEFFGKVQD